MDPFFIRLLYIILKCAKGNPVFHAALYSLSALDCDNGPGTSVK